MRFGDGSSAELIRSKRTAGGNQYGLDFYTDNSPRLSIANNGNVGIGTTTPGFPLSFPDTLGDKIALWGQSGAHYGIGIQTSLLQIYTDGAAKDVAFGFDNSASFTETTRIKDNGLVEIDQTNANNGVINDGTPAGVGLTFGIGSGEGIASKRTAGGNQFGLDFYTGFARRISIANTGNVTIGGAGTTTTINGTCVNNSNRNAKEDFAPVNAQAVLDRLQTLPLSMWKYQGAETRRHIGPMAQDFHAAFDQLLDLNSDDKTIAPLDEVGVAFAPSRPCKRKSPPATRRSPPSRNSSPPCKPATRPAKRDLAGSRTPATTVRCAPAR